MSDTTPITSAIGESGTQLTSTQQVEKDTLITVEEALKIFSLFKSGGAKAALGEFKTAAEIVKQDVSDVKVALPAIKDGLKTSEFWAMVLAGIPIIWMQVRGTPLNPIVATAIMATSAIFGLVRNALKSKQITASALVATSK